MTTNSFLQRLLLAIFLLSGLAPFLFAQSTAGLIETENNEDYFTKRLSWTGGEYALRFEVVVQKEINGTYTTHLREFTESSFLVVSLPPGDYRYQITSFDVLDRPEEVSQWVSFKVLPAHESEDFDTVSELAANGRDGASDTENFSESESENEAGMAKPLKPILLIAGAAWSPVIPLHGNFFGENFSPAGAGARFGTAFPVPGNIYAGAELTALWHINDDENALSLGVNLLAMKWLSNQRMSLNLSLGLSFLILPDIDEKLIFNIGASYLWRFTDNLFLEAGLDYSALLKGKYFDGCIRPLVGIGVIF